MMPTTPISATVRAVPIFRSISNGWRRFRPAPPALLAIVDRELRVAARKPATYRIRFVAALTALTLLFWRLQSFTSKQEPLAELGRSLFLTLSILAFIYCLFAGVRATSDSVSEEKRDGTLGLLFLTDLRGWDVVLGKLAATSLNSLYGLVAVFPALAIPITLGGVTLAEFVSVVVILLNTLFFSLAMGLFVSSLSRNERKAASSAVLAVLAPTLAPVAALYLVLLIFPSLREMGDIELIRRSLPLHAFNPIFAFVYTLLPDAGKSALAPIPGLSFLSSAILDPAYALAGTALPASWYAALPKFKSISPVAINLVCVHLLSWAALRKTARILPEIWKDRPAPRVVMRWQERWRLLSQGNAETRLQFRRALLNANPFQWLTSRDRLKPHYAWLFLVAMIGVWWWRSLKDPDVMFDYYPLIPTLLIVHTFLKVWVAAECSQKLAEDQRNGALELILCTPVTPREIVEGQARALQRQFAWPFLALCALELVAFSGHYSPVSILLVQAMLLADSLTLMQVSMWWSLTAKTLNHAILLSIGLVLAAPFALFLVALGILEQFPTPRNAEVYAAGPGGVALAAVTWILLWRGLKRARPDHWKWMLGSLGTALSWAGYLLWVTFELVHLQRRGSPRWDIPFDQRILIWFLAGMIANLAILRWITPRLFGQFREAVLRRFERTPGSLATKRRRTQAAPASSTASAGAA